MLRKILLVLIFIGGVGVLILFFGCGDPDYQEEWIGSWRETDTGWTITFREDGTVGLKVEQAGVTKAIDHAGTYTVGENTYSLTIQEHAGTVERQDDRGEWERKDNRLELDSDTMGSRILRFIDEDD